MDKNILIKIINEEISGFDYNNNDAYLKELENIEIVENEEFQHQFICDFLTNKNNIKVNPVSSRINGNWEDDDKSSELIVEYVADIEYKYDSTKKPAKFNLRFDGTNGIKVNVQPNQNNTGQNISPSKNAHYTDIKWDDIDVLLSNDNGDVKFIAFEKAPAKIQNLFIREFVENVIEDKTFDTNYIEKDVIKNISYC